MSDLKPALVRLLRAAFPHANFPDGPYERVADKIISQLGEDLYHQLVVEQGLASLEQAGLDGTEDAEVAEKILQALADTEFFTFICGIAVVSLYDDHEVWVLLGYEGGSFDKGGYLERGFDDLDWLPDPRVEEYDGPEAFVEVAEHDQPTSA